MHHLVLTLDPHLLLLLRPQGYEQEWVCVCAETVKGLRARGGQEKNLQ